MKVFTPQDLKQTASSPDQQGIWVVDNLFRTNRKRVSLLCGSPHSGKSTIARQLAIAVAQGKTFLGRDTLKSKVAFWQSEESAQDAAEDFAKSGMQPDDEIVILQSDPADNNLKELNKVLVDDPDIRLVVIETLDDFLQMDDIADNPTARRAFEAFDAQVVSEHMHRCSFVVLHHFKKSDETRGLSLTKILGATVVAGRTDAKVYLRQMNDGDSRRILSAQTRKGTPIEPTYLQFDEKTQSATLGQTLADERADSRKIALSMNTAELRQRTLEIIASHSGLTQTKCCELIGGKKLTAQNTIKSLIEDGLVIVQQGGATRTANLLYLKGKAPEQVPADLPEFINCSYGDCTNFVTVKGDFCGTHKGGAWTN